jgi:hypothetical protein
MRPRSVRPSPGWTAIGAVQLGVHHAPRCAPRCVQTLPLPLGPRSQLYHNSSAHAQEAACAALLRLPEPAACRQLLQLVYLAVARPSSGLERAVVELCHHSLPLALRVRTAGAQPRGAAPARGTSARQSRTRPRRRSGACPPTLRRLPLSLPSRGPRRTPNRPGAAGDVASAGAAPGPAHQPPPRALPREDGGRLARRRLGERRGRRQPSRRAGGAAAVQTGTRRGLLRGSGKGRRPQGGAEGGGAHPAACGYAPRRPALT